MYVNVHYCAFQNRKSPSRVHLQRWKVQLRVKNRFAGHRRREWDPGHNKSDKTVRRKGCICDLSKQRYTPCESASASHHASSQRARTRHPDPHPKQSHQSSTSSLHPAQVAPCPVTGRALVWVQGALLLWGPGMAEKVAFRAGRDSGCAQCYKQGARSCASHLLFTS